ncbi:CheR family methyltransferase [Alkalicoccobacillus plakortidis]|uniref:protein-glutamate O-methyltransferase n=1 Tax=Alkalicoccobacillus plakortidis TaxID=444060 RepID=A0ABT0XEK9_9BACI|nr:protein-glutamate O-methyltransferase CheR [Alkalicoccobacillus plakortidis]MCM2674336.1 protein-glutamate O-methyltransferase CheR [Alkalicoccobacillus plakortidis]
MNGDDYELFTIAMKQMTGIDLASYKEAQMKRRLTSFREKKGYSDFHSYIRALKENQQLLEECLERMTINVSEFYRNRSRWEVLDKQIIPSLLKTSRSLKTWSAACSSGEEPYTLAMLLLNHLRPNDFSILATDLDRVILERAQLGLYGERSIKEVPEKMLHTYFTKKESIYEVDSSLKKQVTFKNQNLLTDSFESQFDLIICRNVMIYFTEEAKHILYKKFSKALRPGGILFVGSTEQIFNPDTYNFKSKETFFYEKIE